MDNFDFLKNKNILITGASGLLGSSFLLNYQHLGKIANITCCYNQNLPSIQSSDFSFIKANLLDFQCCLDITKNIDYVLHFAGIINRSSESSQYLRDNFKIHSNIAKACSQNNVSNTVWISSATAYSQIHLPSKEDDMHLEPPHPKFFQYATMIRSIEKMLEEYAKTSNSSFQILRATAIYGEFGDFNIKTAHILPIMINKFSRKENTVNVYGPFNSQRDFVHAKDVVQVSLLALRHKKTFDTFNIGSGTASSLEDILKILVENTQKQVERIPGDQVEPVSILVDTSKISTVLGFSNPTNLKTGILKTFEWFKSHQQKN